MIKTNKAIKKGNKIDLKGDVMYIQINLKQLDYIVKWTITLYLLIIFIVVV
jgi:hypothetical protein